MSILRDLYNGDVYPAEEIVPRDTEYRNLSNEIGELRKHLNDKLQTEDKAQFEKMDDLILKTSSMYGFANFSYGLKLGLLLMCEVTAGEDKPGR